jgi:hypothetical protein
MLYLSDPGSTAPNKQARELELYRSYTTPISTSTEQAVNTA